MTVSEAGREIDSLNRSAWSKPGVVEYFRTLDDWSEDAGEPTVVSRIAGEVAGRPVLDVGYGGGRTVPILTAISEDYIGIDYTPEMVAAAQARFPTVRLEHGDARDLSRFAAGSFALVFFSANGIDAVPHEGRDLFFREAHRVLQPGGVLTFSTHNLDHRNAGRAPWDPRQRWPRDPRRVLRRLSRLPIAARAYLRNRRLASRGDGWAMLNTPLYDFGLVIHYASLTEVVRELSAAGFAGEVEVYDMFGDSLGPGDDTGATKWFHLITRRNPS
jgi:SAM-dependent methyltransferase